MRNSVAVPFTDPTPWRARSAGGYALSARQRQAVRWLTIIGVVVSYVQMARYLKGDLPHFLVVTPESYTRHFWDQRNWLQVHIAGGLVAFLTGPLQFVPYLRRNARRLHRVVGFSYIVGLFVSAVAGLALALKANGGPIVQAGGVGLAFAWLGTTGMAVWHLAQRRFIPHARWMLRSYVTTLSFIWVRLGHIALQRLGIADEQSRGIIMAWAGWAVPLLTLEVAFLLHFATRRTPGVGQGDLVHRGGRESQPHSRALAQAS